MGQNTNHFGIVFVFLAIVLRDVLAPHDLTGGMGGNLTQEKGNTILSGKVMQLVMKQSATVLNFFIH